MRWHTNKILKRLALLGALVTGLAVAWLAAGSGPAQATALRPGFCS